jgi:hypothetical protein
VFPLKSTLAATPLVRRDVDNMNADDPVLVAYRKRDQGNASAAE